jgi:ABC-type nitrate/sulfonate/bicarbonate transport system permease component
MRRLRIDGAKLLPLLGPAVLFLLWFWAVSAKLVSPVLLPDPVVTLKHLFLSATEGTLMTDFWSTLERTLKAFLIAAGIGVPLGVILGSSERAYRSVEFVIDFFRSTPSSALIPLFLMIFGITDANKIAIAAFAAVLVILFNSAYGVMNARRMRIMAAKVMGASRLRIFWDVLFWESLSQTFVGLRSGISMALVIVVVAEMFIGSEQGLGHRIIDAQQVLNVKEMYASILAAGILGYAMNVFFLLCEKKVVHWAGK